MTDPLGSSYAAAGYNHRLGFGHRPALLLIDFMRAYFDPDSPFYAGVEAALASAQRILEVARKAAIPIVFTRVTYQAGGLDGGIFYRKVPALRCFLAEGGSSELPASLQPTADELIISKQYPSAFFGTSLATTLHAVGVDSVILTGLTTSGCVRASCVDAMSHGFVPIVVRDACGDRHATPHEANLFDMDAKYADVKNETSVIDYLHGIAVATKEIVLLPSAMPLV